MFNVEQLKSGHLFDLRHQKESRGLMLDAGLLIHWPVNHRGRGGVCAFAHIEEENPGLGRTFS
jgi:hypothetical protein